MALNGDFKTTFEVDEESNAVLRIAHDGTSPNRPKITARELSGTSFSAILSHVQYGTWKAENAVLLMFDFHFRFRNESVKRIVSADITLEFEAVQSPRLELPSPHDPKNDPQILHFKPRQVCGEVSTAKKTRAWNLTFPVKTTTPLEAGVEPAFGTTSEFQRDHRMWLVGTASSDDNHYENNRIVWEIDENSTQKSGILHRFPGAVILKLPSDPALPFQMKGVVRPHVVFSLNPIRLVPKRDDAVFLDRQTPKGDPIAPGIDFADPKFPLDSLLSIPAEYSDIL